MYALQKVVDDFKAAGATLVAFSPQKPEFNAKMVESHALDFDILSDPGNVYANELGLRFELPEPLREIYLGFGIDLPKTNGETSWTLPMPGRIVVDRAGIVRDVDVDPDYTVRPEPEATLAAVRALAR